MLENTIVNAGITTDYEITTILSNFSTNFIQDTIEDSINYKFRPFGLRSPNYPEILNNQLNNVKYHSCGYDEYIEETRVEMLQDIIETICNHYGLGIIGDIPDEQLYSMACIMYQIFVSEFTDRMINFFSSYIINNKESYLRFLTEDQLNLKTNYAKKVYNDPILIAIYDNMGIVIDTLTTMDIPFHLLLGYLSDPQITEFITNFIADNGDIYKNHYACYILDPSTKPDIITAIRMKFVSMTAQVEAMFNPLTNPYIK